ncbi:hypothetical protein QQS21_004742 [Conoideocrella luteorostrata]|uniref:Uncharacterized protein n=1 Tax=Conoideocrella luteorostrata TaxID=1105319 RepID=A0AAJ0CQP2_9HYPO|nr:hypothetical protein QQS21_004742 [Conoideocrella luteorostrata]
MSDDVDKSLLERLQALRGASATPEKPAANPIKFDVIERAKTPTGSDVLAARLKSLRSQAESPRGTSNSQVNLTSDKPNPSRTSSCEQDDAVEALFETDDAALEDLEQLLAGVDAPETKSEAPEPKEDDVGALLEELSASIPQDADETGAAARKANDSDDSDGETMTRATNDIMARYKDEIELDDKLSNEPPSAEDEDASEKDTPDHDENTLPSVPLDLPSAPETETTTSSTKMAHLTARMAALRSSEADLPSVPTSRPSKPVNRLTSKTKYTDDDVDSWCTVCLEDATLRCLGCDEDVYCTRCWREMHIGPAAHFDERDHKAVQFTRNKKEKKVALGA